LLLRGHSRFPWFAPAPGETAAFSEMFDDACNSFATRASNRAVWVRKQREILICQRTDEALFLAHLRSVE
jgi:hypothetical protein